MDPMGIKIMAFLPDIWMNQHVAIVSLEIKLDPDKKESDRFPIGFMASQGHQIASLLQSNVVDPATGRQVPDFAEILPAISDLTLDILRYCLYIYIYIYNW